MKDAKRLLQLLTEAFPPPAKEAHSLTLVGDYLGLTIRAFRNGESQLFFLRPPDWEKSVEQIVWEIKNWVSGQPWPGGIVNGQRVCKHNHAVGGNRTCTRCETEKERQ